MFDNIGGKIKGLAKTLCGIGCFVSLLIGLAYGAKDVLSALIIIMVGSLASWVGSFFMYGFGELIENTSKLRELMEITLLDNEPENGEKVYSSEQDALPKAMSQQSSETNSLGWKYKK